MTELDRFEVRFTDAYRRYLGEAPVDVDAGAMARLVASASLPWHRRLPRIRPLGLRPGLAWLALLGLLGAMTIGGWLLAGQRPNPPLPAIVPPVLASCPPGSTPDEPGPVEQARPPTDGWGPMAFDRDSGRIVLRTETNDPLLRGETWTFDVCTNTWARMQPSPEALYGSLLAYDADSDLTVQIDSGTGTWAYDLDANRWFEKGHGQIPGSSESLVYDPVTGLLVGVMWPGGRVVDTSLEVWTYDVERDTWARTGAAGDGQLSGSILVAYDASVDRLVVFDYADGTTAATWLVDLRSGTWTRSRAVPPSVVFGYGPRGGEIAYDEARGETVVFGFGLMIAYDASADRWEVLHGVPWAAGANAWGSQWGPAAGPWGDSNVLPELVGPTARLGHAMVYDPVNERLVVVGGQYRAEDGWVDADDVLAFDPATGGWIQLLAPSRP